MMGVGPSFCFNAYRATLNLKVACCLLVLLLVTDSAALISAPPGPPSLPWIGSPAFLAAALSNKIAPALVALRRNYGPVFMVKTGPVTQVWVDGSDLITQLFQLDAAAGRSQLKEPVFDDDFLFLVRNVSQAKEIRTRQKSLLAERTSPADVAAAVEAADLPGVLLQAFSDGKVNSWAEEGNSRYASGGGGDSGLNAVGCAVVSSASISWPEAAVSEASFDALMRLYVGEQPLRPDEVRALLAATAGYRKRGSASLGQRFAQWLGLAGEEGKVGYADQVGALLETVLARSGAPHELKPLLVSATVGGAEIFPLLLQWAVLRLAVDPLAQQRLHDDLRRPAEPATEESGATADGKASNRPRAFGPLFIQAVAACARDCPVSAAIGPPRKLTSAVEFAGFMLPAEAIVFGMHPGLCAAQGGAPWETNKASSTAMGAGNAEQRDQALRRRSQKEELWPLELDGAVSSWPMFGAGPRACPASEQSLNFLAASLASLVRHFTWTLDTSSSGGGAGAEAPFAFKEDGSLFVPARDTKIRFTLRPEAWARK